MADLIDRQAAIDALNEVSEHYTDKGREWHPHVNFMVEAIENLPSAQPEVIRCKDCKYYEIVQLTKNGEDDKRYKPSVCIKGKYAVGRDKDWFCADAERRTNGGFNQQTGSD